MDGNPSRRGPGATLDIVSYEHTGLETEMAPPTLYMIDGSTPCRAAWMAFRAAEVEVNIRRMDLPHSEQYEDWYQKLNPRHCVPTMDHDGFVLWESRAIMRYVAYALQSEDSPLYPTCPRQRALVDRALDYDLGTLYPLASACVHPVLFGMADEPSEENLKSLRRELTFFNDRATVSNRIFFTGNEVSLADIASIATVTSLEVINFDFDDFPRIVEWIERMKALPFYEECNKGFNQWKKVVGTEEWRMKMKAKQQKVAQLQQGK